MGYGTSGKILHVDLFSETTSVETFDEHFYRLYPGAKALAAYLLLRETQAGTDPLSPMNVLILAVGLLTGSPLATATRFTAAAHSPLTSAYGESEAGGFWGPELKQCGYEAIVVHGRAKEPVYLYIHKDQVNILPANHLWGHHPDEVQDSIRSELGDDKIRILQIGIGGENQVRFASLTNELRHYNGRNGIGAVMGSKNLKAVALRGHLRYKDIVHDPVSFASLGTRISKEAKTHPISWDMHVKGTPGLVSGLNAGGILPTNNFRKGSFDSVENINWEAYEQNIQIGKRSCHACAVRCKPEVAICGKPSRYGGPEYETLAAFGSDCGIGDINVIAQANELCNRYTLDTISTGATIAFAMECFERGLISAKDCGGLNLCFGNTDAMLQAIEWIAHRYSFGNLLAEGSRRLAETIGGEAMAFTMQVKGQELPMHDPRGKTSVGLGYATSEIGADHLVSIHDTMLQNPESVSFQGAQPLGITQAYPAREFNDEKVRQYFILENWVSLEKVIGFCYFGPTPRSFIQVEDVIKAVNAATGWNTTLQELLQIGQRATNLARIFNVREGFSRQDDILPERLFQPLENGTLAGVSISREKFDKAMDMLYNLKGWNPENATPTRARLEELQLGWATDMIGAI